MTVTPSSESAALEQEQDLSATTAAPAEAEQDSSLLDVEQSLDAMAQDLADDIPEEVPTADDGDRTPSANNEDVGFTIDEFAALLSKFDYHFKPGDVVNGTVFNLEPKGALIDIGAKTAAFMPLPEVSINRVETLEEVLEPGETREFFILSEENEDGQLSLSIRRIEYQRAWERVRQLQKEDATIYSEVFATAGSSDVRVWHVSEARELLRVSCPNVECKCVSFMPDGGSILSGWSDGKIRVFAPQTGRLMYTIHDAHKEVSAIVGSSCGGKIVSGGIEGFVRVWRIGPQSQTMLASMKEHKGPVNSLALRANDSECVSACSDGSAIIWDLATFHRRAELTANTFFKACAYHPDESQIVTTGTDRKVSWWEAFDGSAIRVVDGSETAEINSLDVSSDGTQVVTGGGDKDIKVWGYDEGACFHVGKGHSGAVTKVKFTPDGQKIVTVGSEGAIFIWQNMPLE